MRDFIILTLESKSRLRFSQLSPAPNVVWQINCWMPAFSIAWIICRVPSERMVPCRFLPEPNTHTTITILRSVVRLLTAKTGTIEVRRNQVG